MSTPTQQQDFDKRYISASEIMRDLGISRAGFLYGRRNGKLPMEPIVVNDGRVLMWERTPEVVAAIAAWKESVTARKIA